MRDIHKHFLKCMFYLVKAGLPCTDSISNRSSMASFCNPKACVSLNTRCLAIFLTATLKLLVIRTSLNTPLLGCCDKRWLVKQLPMLVSFLFTGPGRKSKGKCANGKGKKGTGRAI